MIAHTPGPWMFEGPSKPSPDAPLGGDYAILDGGTNIIAETFHQVGEDSFRPAEANARLISAAPELLDAALAARAYDRAIESCANDPEKMASFCTAQGDDLDSLYADWQSKSSFAIAKATGERA